MTRFQHFYVQINTGATRRPNSSSTQGIQKRIDNLLTRYKNNKIDAELLVDNLSFLVAKKDKIHSDRRRLNLSNVTFATISIFLYY